MKNVCLTFLFILATLGVVKTYAYAAENPDPNSPKPPPPEHYAHMLSCGQTIYVTHAYELSDEDLLKEVDALEKKHCGN